MYKLKKQNRNGSHIKKMMRSALLLTILFLYLLIPFKQQFLGSIHFVNHIFLAEQAVHSHDHLNGEADHHHGYLAVFNNTINGQQSDHPIPTELVNYQFQIPLPSPGILISEQFPFVIDKINQIPFIPILNGPAFEVPQPPP